METTKKCKGKPLFFHDFYFSYLFNIESIRGICTINEFSLKSYKVESFKS
jgi:hypothetical protein